ncbi:PRC-barrel domain-containing protein [Oceanobacillus massiliensis]|uniref:PRC-barrel domain-containing protein n=1 Tax=Oceanobacillus massiliensis TaxID=1465765 RepID=UPI0002887CDF|nr:PRC-barrel domain-containing protein [Oceanobacillus massiliensis]
MFFYTSQLKDFNIHATDGEMGKIKDLYFNEDKWDVRYAIVDTRKWLPGRKVLLTPSTFKTINKDEEFVEVEYDKEKIRNSPPVPEEDNLSAEQENNLIDYFGWNSYRDNALAGVERGPLGTFEENGLVRENIPQKPDLFRDEYEVSDVNKMRSEDETIGFKVHAKDGKIGKLADMIYDTEQMQIKYIVVKSSDNLIEDEFYIYRTEQIETVDWYENDLYINDSVKGIAENNPFLDKEDIIPSL